MSDTQAVNWEERYQAGTTRWERGAVNPAFVAWRASGALSPCRILVPGAGRSPEPAELAGAGFDVTVLDVAPSAASFQRERLGGAGAVVQSDLFAWAPQTPFDAVYDQTCLCALPPALLPQYEALLARWVRPGGSLFALFMQTGKEGGPPFDCPIPLMRELFARMRWTWPANNLPPAIPHAVGIEEQPAILHRC